MSWMKTKSKQYMTRGSPARTDTVIWDLQLARKISWIPIIIFEIDHWASITSNNSSHPITPNHSYNLPCIHTKLNEIKFHRYSPEYFKKLYNQIIIKNNTKIDK